MVVSKVTRVSNPRKTKRRNPKRKRNLTLKQKLAFGTKRQRAAAKAALSRKRNPKRKKVSVHRKRSNPAHLVTLGLVNPRPRRKSRKANPKRRKVTNMAKARKTRKRRVAANPKRRRRNSVKVIVRHKRRTSNPRRYKRSNPRRRNPQLFGRQATAFELTKAIAGGLAGVAITKAVPNFLPASITSGNAFVNVAVSAAVAVGAGMLVKSLVKSDPTLGDAVMFGGLMQAGSVALNSFLPQVGTYIGLHGLGNGMGDLVAGRFPVPMNPISAGQQLLAAASVPVGAHAGSGVGAIYSPYGRAF